MSAKAKRSGRGAIALTLGVAVVLVALAALWAAFTYHGSGPDAENGEFTGVVLRRGAGSSEIATALDEAGAIRSAAVFKIATRLNGAAAELKAGEYEFASGASMASVVGKIRRGEVVRHFVTVPEGVTAARVAAILTANPVLEGEVAPPPEGSVLPETYDIQRGETRATVLKRMTDAQDALMAELWPTRKPGLPVDTQAQAIILASIVEKETGVARERPRVAAVFTNRLRRGMRLESDPTIIYGLTRGEPLVDAQGRRRGLRQSELARPNAWSTYQIGGLPPTPIANPGRDAIRAVLNPPESDELFFVADGTGGHVFASSFDAHLRNVARWRAVERSRAVAP